LLIVVVVVVVSLYDSVRKLLDTSSYDSIYTFWQDSMGEGSVHVHHKASTCTGQHKKEKCGHNPCLEQDLNL
jgi:hypothetical protein